MNENIKDLNKMKTFSVFQATKSYLKRVGINLFKKPNIKHLKIGKSVKIVLNGKTNQIFQVI